MIGPVPAANNQPWLPEFETSPAEAAALIDAQLPALAPARVEPLAAGWDNSAFLVNGKWVFRFPRRRIGVALLENELRALPSMAGRLPLAVPEPRWIGRVADRPFAGYRRIVGWPAVDVDDDVRRRAAKPLGEFLKALHALRAEAPADELGRLDLARRIPQTYEMLDDPAPFRRVIEAAGPSPAPPVLVHGDLYALHLLVDGGTLTGVIDWGDVHVNNPAADLMVAHAWLPPSAHDAFRDAYGPIDEATWALARFRALHHTLHVLRYARETGMKALERECGRALGFLSA